MAFIKNQAVTGFTFGLVSKTDGSDITTGTPVGRITIDGGTQAAIADTSFVHEGSGQWSVDLTAAEMNGDIISLVFTHTSAVSAHFTIKTSDLIESDGGAPAANRFTKKALELSPANAGGGVEAADYKWSTNTAATDPGTGKIKGNNSTLASITQIYISDITNNSGVASSAIEALAIGDTIVIFDSGNGANLLRVTTTALATDNGAWYTIPVSHTESGGALANNKVMRVELRYIGLTTDQVADAVWRFVLSGITAAGSGAKVVTDVKADSTAILVDTADMQPKLGAPAGASVSVDIAAIKAETTLIVTDTNELQTDDIPGKIAALNDIAATEIVSAGAITTLSGAVVNVDTVDVCAVNTDMRGTNSAALASVATEVRLAELDSTNLPKDVDNIFVDTNVNLSDKLDDIQGATFNTATDSIEAIRNRGDAAWITGNTVVPDNTSIAAILVDTNELQTDWADGGRLDLLLDRVIAQIDTAITEPGTGLPPVSAKMADKIGYLYKSLVNKSDQTNVLNQLYNNDGTTVGQKRTVSANASIAAKEPLISG